MAKKKASKQRGIIMLVAGLIALGIGAFVQFSGNIDAINQANMDIATHATSAEEAAKRISANNRRGVDASEVSMFLLGVGSVLTLASVVMLVLAVKQSRQQ